MCAGLPAERGPRLELLTRSVALRYAGKQKGKSTLNDTATSLLLYALSFSHSLIHYAAAIVVKLEGTQREVKTAITTDQLQRFFNDTNEKSSGWMREDLRLNATLGFFTNACVDSILWFSTGFASGFIFYTHMDIRGWPKTSAECLSHKESSTTVYSVSKLLRYIHISRNSMKARMCKMTD